jgi:hypothetical protein
MQEKIMTGARIAILSLVLAASAVLAAAACGDDDDDDDVETTATHTASETAEGGTPTPEPFGGGRDPIEVAGGAAPPVCTLVDVRAEAHEGFDRAIFQFQDCVPGYRIEYVEGGVGCGSGEPEEIAGSAFLQVQTNPAMAHDDAGNTTVPALELTPNLDAIVELDSTCDFEGYVTWVMGLNAEADFRVITGEGDLLLMVDVQT